LAKNGLSAKEKASILLISLGPDYSAQIYKYLNDDEIEQLTLSITSIRKVAPEVREKVLDEFHEICLAERFIAEGGIDYAREVLEKAIGQQRALDLIGKLTSSLQVRPFDFVRKSDPLQIVSFLQNESMQTIALVLSYLDPLQASQVLSSMPKEKQSGIIGRVAKMGSISPEYIKDAERVLERRISSMGVSDQLNVGGLDSIVNILNCVDRGTEKFILETLELNDAELADDIRKKLFVFEDIAKLDNRAVQRVLREVENNTLAIALKGTTDEVSKIIFSNVSKRLVDMIKDEMEFMGPVRVKDVEEAQQAIVNVVRKLEDQGEIVTSRGGDDLVV
jgi:flagellar motor switch protein FliG